jgi:hypothetical protein
VEWKDGMRRSRQKGWLSVLFVCTQHSTLVYPTPDTRWNLTNVSVIERRGSKRKGTLLSLPRLLRYMKEIRANSGDNSLAEDANPPNSLKTAQNLAEKRARSGLWSLESLRV